MTCVQAVLSKNLETWQVVLKTINSKYGNYKEKENMNIIGEARDDLSVPHLICKCMKAFIVRIYFSVAL